MKTDNKNSYHADGCLKGFPGAMCPEHGSLGKPVSSKAAEAPGGQDARELIIKIHEICDDYTTAPTLSKHTELGVVTIVEDLCQKYLAAPAAPSERADAELEIVDRATGAKGTLCISRKSGIYSEFWNPAGWAESGYVFTDRKLAEAVRDLLAGLSSQERK